MVAIVRTGGQRARARALCAVRAAATGSGEGENPRTLKPSDPFQTLGPQDLNPPSSPAQPRPNPALHPSSFVSAQPSPTHHSKRKTAQNVRSKRYQPVQPTIAILLACFLPDAMAFLTNLPSLRWQVRHVLSLVILLRLCGLPVPHGDPLRFWSYDGKDLSDHHDVWCMSDSPVWMRQLPWCVGARGGTGKLHGLLGKPCSGIVVFCFTCGTPRMYSALHCAYSWARFTWCPLVRKRNFRKYSFSKCSVSTTCGRGARTT